MKVSMNVIITEIYEGKSGEFVTMVDLDNGGQITALDATHTLSSAPKLQAVNVVAEMKPRRFGRSQSLEVQNCVVKTP